MTRFEADAVWDEWCATRAQAPELSLEEFVARYAEHAGEALEILESLCAVEENAPLPSLLRVLQPDEKGQLCFAGFRLLRELGEGSAGIVYEAIDERNGAGERPVALKILNPLLGNGRAQRDVILREARITRELEHPSIVRVLDSGTEQGYAWIATEKVEGEVLDEWISPERSPEERIELALEVGAQVCSALGHAHDHGILHRDLKPANVIRTEEGTVKVLDFGLARREGMAFGVSRTGEAVGTPLYMAPEQLRGERDLDGRADLYALGLVMLELATGKRLLVREGALRALARIARGSGRFPRRFFGGLPEELAGVLSRCLEPDRRDRYGDAGALREDLEALGEGRKPRLGRIGGVRRFGNSVVRRPVRAALKGLVIFGALWLWMNWPISVTIDSIASRPGRVTIDGVDKTASLPLNHTFWGRGSRTVEFSDGTYRYPFEIDIHEDGARSFFLPYGPLYPRPRPLIELTEGEKVAFVQVGVRPADRSDFRGSYSVGLEIPGLLDRGATGISTFPLPISTDPYVLRIEHEGMRSREVPISVADGRTRSVMVELDEIDSPWHTILVSSPLDPRVETGTVRSENLALRWEKRERDAYTGGFVHHVGLGVIDADKEGLLHFTITLPVVAEEIEFLGIADPSVAGGAYGPGGLTIAMGPSEHELVPLLVGYADLNPVWPKGFSEADKKRVLSGNKVPFRGIRELHVCYRTKGAHSWILRTNSQPRRLGDSSIQWDPALRLRVREAGTEADPPWPTFPEPGPPRGPAARVIDLAGGVGIFTFDGGPPGALVRLSLAAGRDANGDGTNDFAIMVDDGAEQVEIRSGRDGSVLRRMVGEEGDGFGTALAFTPDLDGDGCAELLIGAIRGDETYEDRPGYVDLYSGGTGELLARMFGEKAGDLFGLSVEYLGDIDGTGRLAAVVSTNEYKSGGWGRAEIRSLPDLERIYPAVHGREQCDHFGAVMTALGDTNGDGIPDFVVGAKDEDSPWWDSGGIYVFSGKDGEELLHLSGQRRFQHLGRHVAPAGDLDGDGNADFLTWAIWPQEKTGVFALSGRDGRVLRAFYSLPGPLEERFESSALVTDLDLDGHRDIAVHGYRMANEADGSVSSELWIQFAIVFSSATSRPLLEIRSVPGPQRAPALHLAPAPDVNGDGREDLLVGVGRREVESETKLLFVLSGE